MSVEFRRLKSKPSPVIASLLPLLKYTVEIIFSHVSYMEENIVRFDIRVSINIYAYIRVSSSVDDQSLNHACPYHFFVLILHDV